MEINSYNQVYTSPKLGFGAVIPVRVFVDGEQIIFDNKNWHTPEGEKILKETKDTFGKAIRTLTRILQKQDVKHPKANTFIEIFKENVPDFVVPATKVASGIPAVRPVIDKFFQCLFTNGELDLLNLLGAKIGCARRENKDYKVAARNLYSAARNFVKDTERRLKSPISKEPNELLIYTIRKGKPDSKNFKLIIDDVRFTNPYVKPELKAKSKPVQLELFSPSVLKKVTSYPDN